MANGKIFLSGFELEEAEKAIVGNIINNYKHKIDERAEYEYIKLRLKKSRRGKAFLHEVKGSLKKDNKILNSKSTDYNLFAATAEVMENLMNEMIHKMRTRRQK
ncbi:hypothetical protein FJZ19_00915 [Candidatus Pacearchaeota archaeon]|nr:hypothetical protein [Candidatus Pacearchaeota archaeon]